MSDRDPIRIQRENRVVKNIETSLKFYHDVLGFDIDSVKDLPNSSYAYDLFDIPRGASIRTARLSSKSQLRVLALTEYTERPGGAQQGFKASGIVLEIDDVDRVITGARDLGLTVMPEYQLTTGDGRKGREAGIIDFDGHLVVIYTITQTTPA